MTVTAVPRSGWRMMSSTGSSARPPAIARSASVGLPRRLSPKYFASTSATAMRANSEGWRLKKPSGIQRRAPPRTTPKNIT